MKVQGSFLYFWKDTWTSQQMYGKKFITTFWAKFANIDVFRKIKNTLFGKCYNGLLIDRDLSVNEAVFKLLFNWFKACDFNLEKFIALFKIETFFQ